MNKLALAILIILAGCIPGGNTPAGPQFYAAGTQGVEAVINPASTEHTLMCSNAQILLDLHNLGTADVAQGGYSLVVEDQILRPLGRTKKQGSFALEGRSSVNPNGGYTQLAFTYKAETLPAQLETYQTPFIFNSCYPYSTSANIPVCIDPTRDPQAARSCTTTTVSSQGGQGAPVAITQVEPIMAVQDNAVLPTFIISIANIGKGRVVSPDSLGLACGNPGSTPSSKVRVNAQLQDEKLTCRPEIIDLRLGETRVTCYSNTYFGAADGRANQGTFTTPLTIQLEYGYVNTLFFPITITRLPHQENCVTNAEEPLSTTSRTNTRSGVTWPPQS